MSLKTTEESLKEISEQLQLLVGIVSDQALTIKKQQLQIEDLETATKAKKKLTFGAASVGIPQTPLQKKYQDALDKASSSVGASALSAIPPTTASSSTTTASSIFIPPDTKASLPRVMKLGPQMKVLSKDVDIEEWFNYFEMMMEPFGVSDQSYILTLRIYLSEDMTRWLAQLPKERRSTYDVIKYTIMFEYQVKSHVGIEELENFLKLVQEKNQPVNTYYSLLIAKSNRLTNIGQPVSSAMVAATFLRGLLPEVQSSVRFQVSNTDPLDKILNLALKVENDLLELKEASKLRQKSNPMVNPARACPDCGAILTNPKFRRCPDCHHQNRDSPPSHAKPSPPPTVPPKTNPGAMGKPAVLNPEDCVTQQVPLRSPNNNDANPLNWKTSQLKDKLMCTYCGVPLSKHGSPDCRSKYPQYMPDEVRSILLAGKVPLPRTKFPSGPRTMKPFSS